MLGECERFGNIGNSHTLWIEQQCNVDIRVSVGECAPFAKVAVSKDEEPLPSIDPHGVYAVMQWQRISRHRKNGAGCICPYVTQRHYGSDVHDFDRRAIVLVNGAVSWGKETYAPAGIDNTRVERNLCEEISSTALVSPEADIREPSNCCCGIDQPHVNSSPTTRKASVVIRDILLS